MRRYYGSITALKTRVNIVLISERYYIKNYSLGVGWVCFVLFPDLLPLHVSVVVAVV